MFELGERFVVFCFLGISWPFWSNHSWHLHMNTNSLVSIAAEVVGAGHRDKRWGNWRMLGALMIF